METLHFQAASALQVLLFFYWVHWLSSECGVCPQYNVYSARKEGEAVLAHAQSSREVAVAEAKAKMESAALLAQADTIRAHGIATSNRIIGLSLQDNPAYLQWLWIDQLKDTKDQVIYVPSSTMGLPILEANRTLQPK